MHPAMRWPLLTFTVVAAACAPRDDAPAQASDAAASPRAPAAPTLPFVARGNEPGWILNIGPDSLILVTDYGATRISAAAPSPEVTAELVRYTTADAGVTVEVVPTLCRDDMSGLPHPEQVTVMHGDSTLHGCGGATVDLLTEGQWVVQSVEGVPVTEEARPTLRFDAAGRVAGSTSCNDFTGPYTLSGEGLRFGPAAATRKACPPPLMDLEQRFLAALRHVNRFDFDDSGALILVGTRGTVLEATPTAVPAEN